MEMRQLRRCMYLGALAVVILAASGAAAEKVSVRTETVVIPTFEISKGLPTANLFTDDYHGSYPRTTLDIGTRSDTPVDREYQMAVLENDLLRVEINPAVGGRIWRIIDRKSDRNLLWTNDAVKPVRVGRRGGWLAGGIEYPFPVGNHGEDTMDPYRWSMRENEDGSATVTVMSFDHYYRFWGSYDVTVEPGKARLALTARLYNPTAVRNRYQFWINAAVPVQKDMQYVMPVEWVAGHGFGGTHPWPMLDDGKTDRSFWGNQKRELGVFGWNADFMAAYYHDGDYGLVRYSSPRMTEGIKMWTWGTDSRWTREYAVNMGPYGEIQGGRWATQDMYRWLEPRQMDTWTEYWYPVSGLGGIDAASKDAAMNVTLLWEDESHAAADVRLAMTVPVDGKLHVACGGREAAVREVRAKGGETVAQTVDLGRISDDDVLTVSLTDAQGFVLVRHEVALVPKRTPKPDQPRTVTVEGQGESWDRLAEGLTAELIEANPGRARRVYEQIVQGEGTFAAGWKALGILAYKQLDVSRSMEALAKAVELAPEDAEARYYLALAKLDAGDKDAVESLKQVSGDAQFAHAAQVLVGLEALKSGDYPAAVSVLKKAGGGWSRDPAMWDYLAVAARLAGDPATAGEALDAALSAEPLDPLAMTERLVAAGTATEDALRNALGTDDDLYIEVAYFYSGIGQAETALKVAQAGARYAFSGLYYYHLAYLAARAGDASAAAQYAARADEMGTAYVFPHRREDYGLFDATPDFGSNAGYAKYHQGVLMYWLGRGDDAVTQWTGILGRYEVPGLRRKVADAYYQGKLYQDLEIAVDMYRVALEENPADIEAYYSLDEVYELLEDREARQELLARGRELFPQDDQMALRMAKYLAGNNKAADAEKLVLAHKFHKAHQEWRLMHVGNDAVREIYWNLARDAMREGDKDKAFQHLEKAVSARDIVNRWFE